MLRIDLDRNFTRTTMPSIYRTSVSAELVDALDVPPGMASDRCSSLAV